MIEHTPGDESCACGCAAEHELCLELLFAAREQRDDSALGHGAAALYARDLATLL